MRIHLQTPTGIRVLLIDDNQGRKSVFEAMLIDSGYAISQSVGADADLVARTQRTDADIILINDSAPGWSLMVRNVQ